MLASYFDTLLNCIYDYIRLAKCTSECIRETLSNIPHDVKKLPETAEIIRQYISFSSDTDLKCALLKAKTKDLIEVLNSTFDSGMNTFCLGRAELLFIKNFCKSTSKLICGETHHPPLCFELGFACFQLSLSIDNCLDAQAALCRALTNLFLATEKIVIPETELLCLGFSENSFDTALQLIDSDGSFRAPTQKKTANERFSDLPKQAGYGFSYIEKSYSLQVNENGYVTENYSFSSGSTGYGKSAKSVHIREHINTSHHHRPASTPKIADAKTHSAHAANTKVPVTVKKKDTSEIKYNTPVSDMVRFSAAAPASIKSGETMAIDIFMYTDKFRSVVDDAIKNIEGSSVEKTSGYAKAEKNSKIKIILSCNNNVNVTEHPELEWIGNYLLFSFFADVPKEFCGNKLCFTAQIYTNGVFTSQLLFTVNVNEKSPQLIEPTQRKDIKSAFVSYSSLDREMVSTILYGMELSNPDLDLFFDYLSLRNGDKWEERLKNEVEKRDVLYLFWSKNAKNSDWVDKEWRWALKTHGIDSIIPIALEPTDVCPVPEELSSIHFQNRMFDVINSLRTNRVLNHPRLVLKSNGTTKLIDSSEFIIGNSLQAAHYSIDDSKYTGAFLSILHDKDKYFIKKTSEEVSIKVNNEDIKNDTLIPLENCSTLFVDGKEMTFYESALPSKSTKTA